ncbi:MAG: hypothetical protein NTX25_00475 [Proteobacteria bacterium]|nr:hypothetical protein [Pseudomonadota bacterium]
MNSDRSEKEVVLDYIQQQPINGVMVASAVSAIVGIDVGRVKEVLFGEMKSGHLTAVFRLVTNEPFLGYSNEWTAHLSSLNNVFETLTNNRINGGDPENIEVAFKKVQG